MRIPILDPQALLLDEPLGALDPLVCFESQAELSEIFRSLRKTVVRVTHALADVAFSAGWLVLLQQRRLVRDGSLDDFRALDRAVRAAFPRKPGTSAGIPRQ